MAISALACIARADLDCKSNDSAFLARFKSGYLESRLSGGSTFNENNPDENNRNIKSLENIIKFLRETLNLPNEPIEDLLTSSRAIEKLGEKQYGYIDTRVRL